MRSLPSLVMLCMAAATSAQDQRVDHVVGFAVSDASLSPPTQEHRLTPDPAVAKRATMGPDSLMVMSPAMISIRARLAVKPSSRWADSDILDGTELELGGCDRVLMGLFFTSSAGNSDVMEWRYSRFDALNLLMEYGVGDAVHETKWGPTKNATLDLERMVPFTLRPGASMELDCAFDADDPTFHVVVYAAGPHQAVHEVYNSSTGSAMSFRTANTSDEPLHLLVTAWTKSERWQQNRIMSTSQDIRVRGLKYYEFDFDGWNAVEQVAARVSVRFRKER